MSMLLAAKALQIEFDNAVRKLILTKMADNADDAGVCWPSYSYLARLSGCSVRTAQRHVKWLADNHFLHIKYRKKSNKDNLSNLYFLTIDDGIKHLEKIKGAGVTVSLPLASQCHPPSDTVSPPWCHGDTPLASQCHPEPIIESINEPIIEPKNTNAREALECENSDFDLIAQDEKPKPNPKPKQPKKINIEFEEVWDLYAKKVGSPKKLKSKWEKLTNQERQLALERIPDYVKATPEKQYRKNFETYLNNKSWNDEIIQGASHEKSQRDNKQTAYEQLTNGKFKPYEPFRVDSDSSGRTLDGEVVYDANSHIPSLAQQH